MPRCNPVADNAKSTFGSGIEMADKNVHRYVTLNANPFSVPALIVRFIHCMSSPINVYQNITMNEVSCLHGSQNSPMTTTDMGLITSVQTFHVLSGFRPKMAGRTAKIGI